MIIISVRVLNMDSTLADYRLEGLRQGGTQDYRGELRETPWLFYCFIVTQEKKAEETYVQ